MLLFVSCRPPASAPSAPTNVVATYSTSQNVFQATWSAPASDGGSPVLGYSVACSSTGGAAVPAQYFPGAGTLSTEPGGLAGPFLPNVPYTCSVTASNALGNSPPSAPSNEVSIPLPSAPTLVQFTPSCLYSDKGGVLWSSPVTTTSGVYEYQGDAKAPI